MADFPVTLPRPSSMAYSVPSIVKWIKTYRTWKRSVTCRKRRHAASFVYDFTEDEYEIYRDWYLSSSVRGANWFSMWIYSGSVDIQQDLRYIEPYEKTKSNKIVSVKVKVEFDDREVLTQGETAIMLGI